MTAFDIAPDIRQQIGERLDAVESGSRAWGFPSPNSDYDVRFVYVHRPEWYLSIRHRRDVIELPLEGVFDINGWDLQKALPLLIKPNPVLHEWLASPIVYRECDEPVARIRSLADETFRARPVTFHYLNIGESQWRRFIDGKDQVSLKKYFYALRPALALRWMRLNPERRVPMSVPELRSGVDLPVGIAAFLEDLIARKKQTKELGEGPRIPDLDRFIVEEFELAKHSADEILGPRPALLEKADDLFRDILRTCADRIGPAQCS